MNIKQYLYAFFGIFACLPIATIYARWYDATSVKIEKNSGFQFCPDDGTIDTPHPSEYNVPMPGDKGGKYYYQQSRATGGSSLLGVMTCEKWDPNIPEAGDIVYHDGWSNDKTIRVRANAFDEGGSTALKGAQVIFQEQSSTRGPEFQDGWSGWRGVSNIGYFELGTRRGILGDRIYTEITLNKGDTKGTAYRFRYKVIDGAGNESSWTEGTSVYKLDTSEPILDNISVRVTPNPLDNGDDDTGNNSSSIAKFNNDKNNFMAGDKNPIEIIYNNQDGSPIKIHYSIENDDIPSQKNSFISGDFKYRFRLPHEFKKIDNDLDNATGGREITFTINKIVDDAGNEKIINRSFSFYMFANIAGQINVTPSTSGNGIADGSEHYLTQELKDEYDNKIIPAPKIGRALKRTTQTDVNTMFLNQQTRTGTTSVFVNDRPLPLSSGDKMENLNQQPRPGTSQYAFKLQVYTPTESAYGSSDPVSDPDARFALRSWLTISDDQNKIRSVANKDIVSHDLANPVFKPLFTNKIQGNLRDGGFIEGAIQNSQVPFTKNSASQISINPQTLLNYSGSQSNQFDLYSPQNRQLIIGQNTVLMNYPNLITFLKQKPNVVGGISKLQLSTHFNYSLNGKNILYNGDIIGKAHYHDGNEQDLGNQVGIKIIGNSNARNLNLILNNQSHDIGNSIGENSVQNVRNSINHSILLATRNIPLRTAGTTLANFDTIPSGSGLRAGMVQQGSDASIMLIEGSGNLSLSDVTKISGKRTLVLRGVNLYINKDMAYSNSSSILGVVIYKDKNGNGGNLYIDPSVTNIVGHYMTDGAVMSYHGSAEIISGEANVLKNQLHIYGSLISYNTIGGSRSNPVRCPAFITTCTNIDSQKYDLNFLRRYYLYNGKPFGNGKVVGGGTINDSGNVIGLQSGLRSLFTKADDDLAKYPVIIEYNPLILTNPPIGFEAYR